MHKCEYIDTLNNNSDKKSYFSYENAAKNFKNDDEISGLIEYN